MAIPSKNQQLKVNPSSDHGEMSGGRIHKDKSVLFCARIQEVIGDEAVASFGRRAGISESTLRTIIGGAWPRTDNLVAIANAGGVEVGWLATGKGVKWRRDADVEKAVTSAPTTGEERASYVKGSAREEGLLPRREVFLDCTGRERAFELSQGKSKDGAVVYAREVKPSKYPGYVFSVRSATLYGAISRIRERIRDGLSRRYLVEHPSRGMQLLSSTIEGRIAENGLVIDGLVVDYDQIRRLLNSFEGRTATIRIKDSSE